MLNVTFAGNLYNAISTQYIDTEVKYQALYYRQLDGYTKWNDIRYSESGQYNCNLGDGDWLSQNGSGSNGDKVIICFWTDNTKNRNDFNLTEWSFIEVELDGSDTYIIDVQTLNCQTPTCMFSTTGNIILDNIGTHNNQEWLFNTIPHYQEYQRYGEILFDIMSFDVNCVNIDWGDTNIEIDDIDDYYDHEYDHAGDYHIIVKVYNRCGFHCQSEFDVTASFNISNGLTWINPIYKDNISTYTPAISGDTFQIIEVDYFINGVLEYSALDFDESFDHIFNDCAPHEIIQRIKYDNITGDKYQSETYTVYLDTIADFYKDDGTCGPLFVDNSNIGNCPAQEYYWYIKYNGEVIAEQTSLNETWEYNWPYTGTFTVGHKVIDSFGNEFGLERIYEVNECGTGSSNDGGSGGGGWVETKYIEIELPKMIVKKVEEIDEHRLNINIKTTLMR